MQFNELFNIWFNKQQKKELNLYTLNTYFNINNEILNPVIGFKEIEKINNSDFKNIRLKIQSYSEEKKLEFYNIHKISLHNYTKLITNDIFEIAENKKLYKGYKIIDLEIITIKNKSKLKKAPSKFLKH